MKNVVVCITGGHLTPALAVIEEIQRQHSSWNMFFIGRSHAFEGGGSPAHEERLVKVFGIPFYSLTTGRLERHWSLFGWTSLLKVPVGFFQAFGYLLHYHPTIVVSFGGYIALPVVVAAWMLGIPVITHEQTSGLGLANAIIARFSRRVLLAREIGVPIRNALFHSPAQPPSFLIDSTLPLIYITGGSTGATSLNRFVYPNIEELTRQYCVIHQVGILGMAEASRVKDVLPKVLQSRYLVVPYLDTSDVAWIYHHAILLIGRAGANTVAEVSALGLPALFIPLPWAAGNEQSRNAGRLEKLGTAVVLDQHILTHASFLTTVEKMMRNIHTYRSAAMNVAREYPRSAARNIVQEISVIIDPTAS